MFGWEVFLSERDKKHDQLWGKKEPFGLGTRPAVLLIDMYYRSVGFKREPIFESMKTFLGSAGLEGWAAIDKTAELISVARQQGVPVIHIQPLKSGMKHFVQRKHLTEMSNELRLKAAETVAEVAPIEGEITIGKTGPSAFQGTPLAFHLNSIGIDTLVLCGETTSGCVRATAVDAATARYKVGVVADCVYDRTEASHYISLYDMHQKCGDVITADDAKAYLSKRGVAEFT
jgi:nicotinamidase-related amidase